MTIAGSIYGVVLNDRDERERLAPAFTKKPYGAAPQAPVVYMKPLGTVARGAVPAEAGEVLVASPTLALLFARDASRCCAEAAFGCVGAAALAIDLSLPQPDYYRPAVGQAIRDGSLVLGEWTEPVVPDAITTAMDGLPVHAWSLSRLVRDPAELIAELSHYLTLRAGDVLLVGLPGDAPRVSAGQRLLVQAAGLTAVSATICGAR